MKEKIKTQNGITLVALIVTIIIMLILAAVIIKFSVDRRLINSAENAVGAMQNTMDNEGELINEIKEEYTGGITTEHSWTRTGDTFICSHCNTTYEMGQVINYKPTGKASTSISAEKSGLDKYYTKNSSYPEDANIGENGSQIIERDDTTPWIVLGIEDTNLDGINETLLITTQSPVHPTASTKLYFYGAAAYNNAISELNRICRELYSNSEYGTARGMTIEDVNSALNYTPMGGIYGIYENSTWKYYTTNNWTTKLKDIPIWNNIKGNCQTPDGTNTEDAFGEYELNGYYYYLNGTALANPVNSNTTTITTLEKNTIFGSSGDYLYWLASRGVFAGSDYATFGPGHVNGGYAYSCGGFFYRAYGIEPRHRRFPPCSFSKVYSPNSWQSHIIKTREICRRKIVDKTGKKI